MHIFTNNPVLQFRDLIPCFTEQVDELRAPRTKICVASTNVIKLVKKCLSGNNKESEMTR